MSEETAIDAGMNIAEVKQMEEGKVKSPEGEGSPEKFIIDGKIQEREHKINGVGRSLGGRLSIHK